MIETRLKSVLVDINKVILMKKFPNNQAILAMHQTILFLKHFNRTEHASSLYI